MHSPYSKDLGVAHPQNNSKYVDYTQTTPFAIEFIWCCSQNVDPTRTKLAHTNSHKELLLNANWTIRGLVGWISFGAVFGFLEAFGQLGVFGRDQTRPAPVSLCVDAAL